METEKTEKKDILNSKLLKVLIKSLLVIIGLFVVFSYGIVTLVVLRLGNNLECKVILLILFFAIIPLIVLFGFFCFVNKMSYWFTSNKNDETIFNIKNIKQIIDTFIKMAKGFNSKFVKEMVTPQKLFTVFLERFFKINLKEKEND
jgi:hypothetical protein